MLTLITSDGPHARPHLLVVILQFHLNLMFIVHFNLFETLSWCHQLSRITMYSSYSGNKVSTEVDTDHQHSVNVNAIVCVVSDSKRTFQSVQSMQSLRDSLACGIHFCTDLINSSAKWWCSWSIVGLLQICIQQVKCFNFPCCTVHILHKASQVGGEGNRIKIHWR